MFSFYNFILQYKKGTLAWNEVKIQKLDKQYTEWCKYEAVFKSSKILSQI